MRIAFVAFTRAGAELMRETAVKFAVASERVGDEIALAVPRRLAADLGLDGFDDIGEWAAVRFADSDALVFVGATGIAVRAIAPHVDDKFADPAVVCMDERGRVIVPLLSGHVGGANGLARELAACTGGIAAVSTATDVEGVFAVDEWAREHGMAIVERDLAKEVSAALLEGEPVGWCRENGDNIGDGLCDEKGNSQGIPSGPFCHIGVCAGVDAGAAPFERTLHLVPRVATVGVGCRRGTDPAALVERVLAVLAEIRIDARAVARVASVDAKREEPAIAALADALGCPAVFYSAAELEAVEGEFAESAFVRETVGTGNVCERAAVLGSEGGRLVVPKRAGDGMTVAVAFGDFEAEAPTGLVDCSGGAGGESPDGTREGRLAVVGLGPGAGEGMTPRARRALEESDVIVGYTTYVELVRREFPGKPFLETPMRHEVERCEVALERAAAGERVAMVCSGDPGVYGMAGLCLELADEREGDDVEVEVVPGVTAANGGAAVLGAPLVHDFAVISLSDLLTPWEKIEARLEAAAESDLVVCLYNPSSRKRADYLRRACDVLLRGGKAADTVCGTVRNIGREWESARVMTLSELRETRVDMFTTVFVGNSQTRVVGGRMVTPRGYRRRGRGDGGGEWA